MSDIETTNMQQETVLNYPDHFSHLADELKRLDLFIRQKGLIIRSREARRRELLIDSRLYVSDEEVDVLLSGMPAVESGTPTPQEFAELTSRIEILTREIEMRAASSQEAGILLTLPVLANTFGLNRLETLSIVICLAPELRRKYEKLYVYLQDDITRKKPCIDLILEILCDTEADKWKARGYFSSVSRLFRNGILEVIEDGYAGSGSNVQTRSLRLAPRFVHYLTGWNTLDEELAYSGSVHIYQPSLPMEDVLISPEIKQRIASIVSGHILAPLPGRKPLLLHFHGPVGVGKRELALALSSQLNIFMLHFDIGQWIGSGADTRRLIRLAMREGLLQHALVFIDGIDLLQAEDPASLSLLKSLVSAIEEFGWIVILSGENPWAASRGLFPNAVFLSTQFEVPGFELSKLAWEKSLAPVDINKENDLASCMALQYRFTPGQIRDAVESAYYHDILGTSSDPEPITQLTLRHLAVAGRNQSDRKLAQLAVKIESRQDWTDMILPQDKIQSLKEICDQVKHRHQVFDTWGFGRKISRGGGLSMLFTGSPGTGKTMAAGVMARELQLDLYKIDLSGVVSKYIGETEKNLSRIFHEASACNGILFFDEADALFGKRSEVSDAHDRYANIETSYLLQRMEEYDGIVILATNFRKNIDDAFTRRIRYVVEFPFPDEESRCRIWEGLFPVEAPKSESIDFKYLARQFPLSGGHIKNIVLDAAFLAAGNGGCIGMEHLLQGIRKEYEKIGKIWDGGCTPGRDCIPNEVRIVKSEV